MKMIGSAKEPRVTVSRNVITCHATRGFLAAVGPYPRPDCGEAQIPGGWAVQLGVLSTVVGLYIDIIIQWRECRDGFLLL